MTRSGMARPLDFKLPSNRVAAAGLVAGAALALLRRRPAREALAIGLSPFVAWALARELHPDDPAAADLALVLEIPVAQLAPGGVSANFMLLQALRALAGTTGVPLGAADALGTAALTLLASARGAGAGSLAPAIALGLSAREDDRLRAEPWMALAAGGALGSLAAKGEGQGQEARHHRADALAWLVLAALAATLPAVKVSGVLSAQDHALLPVSARRVRLARQLALGTLAAVLITGRGAGLRRYSPLLCAWIATALRS